VGIFRDVNVTAAPAARVGRRLPHERIPRWALPWIGVASVLVLFELLSRSELISSRSLPPVTEWAQALLDVVGEESFWTAVGNTLQGWALGLGIASAIAIPLGIVLGSSRLLYRALRAVIEFLRPIPSVALIPLAVLVWGTGLSSKVFLAAFASTWPLLMQTLYGVQDVDPVSTDTARSFGFGRVQRLLRVTLPSAVPYIATGVRISSSVALILAITAELVIGSAGLGREINLARQGGAIDLMYALIVVTGLLGWALNAVLARVERRALHWHPSYRASEAVR
jgi:ABC-type nitrate/sulfonate/bicarbonate transport system permease component